MARNAEQIVESMIGKLVVDKAMLLAQLEEAHERIVELEKCSETEKTTKQTS